MAVIARDKEYAKQKKLNHVVSKNAHSIQTVVSRDFVELTTNIYNNF
jgi:hypothetical protein